MGCSANVLNIDILKESIDLIVGITDDTYQRCDRALDTCNRVVEETQNEENVSRGLLEAAKAVEAAKYAILAEAEAELAAAVAEEAAAVYSGNPVAAAAAAAKISRVTRRVAEAREEYEQAKQHWERLEQRYEMAVECVKEAQEMFETIQNAFHFSRREIERATEEGLTRLQWAYEDLSKYVSETAPEVLIETSEWRNWEPDEKKPVSPMTVHDRLNVSNAVLNSILVYLYATDIGFRNMDDGYRNEAKTTGNRDSVILKIRKNMAGRLAEETVIKAFSPLGERVETQERVYFDDGGYTKVDLIVRKLKQPLILGKGEGMGAREGADLAVEVKSGKKEYLYSQMSHMQKQAEGHTKLSCTVCTRDIKELSSEKEAELRKTMAEAGSPLLGMLPLKEELDAACIEFVLGEKKNVQ